MVFNKKEITGAAGAPSLPFFVFFRASPASPFSKKYRSVLKVLL
jgi:hypothetical protein